MMEFLQSHGYNTVSYLGIGSVGTIYKVSETIGFKIVRKNDIPMNIIKQESIITKLVFPTDIEDIEDNEFYGFAILIGVSMSQLVDSADDITKYKWSLDLCNDLEWLHQIDVYHNDINWNNVIIFNNHARFCDFGSSRYLLSKAESNHDINRLFYVLKELNNLPERSYPNLGIIRNLLARKYLHY